MAIARVERRLAAIMAADVVGYSRLIEADEAGTLEAIRDLRRAVIDPLLARSHGRIVKLMGDGLIGEFGSVVDAVACAAAMQRGVAARQAQVPPGRRIVFRIGVNLGDVVVEGEDLLGDGVNVAARLEQLCEPGGVLVSGTAYDHLQGKLDLSFDDAGEQRLKNIARPVRTWRIRLDGAKPTRRRWNAWWPRRWALPAAAAALIALVLVAGAWWWFRPDAPASGPPAIAVLPFVNMSGDPAQDYLGAGVAEDIITVLATFPGLRVISRLSSFTYDKPVKAQEVGRELGVRYVVEGSVRRNADKVRVTAQLIDAGTGDDVWANRFDEETTDAVALQEQVANRIYVSLAGLTGEIRKGEQQTAWQKSAPGLEEYDYYLRGHDLFFRFTPEDNVRAMQVWQEGLAKFPDSALLRIKLGFAHLEPTLDLWVKPSEADLDGAWRLGQEAMAAADKSRLERWLCHWLMAFLYAWHDEDFERSVAEAEAAVGMVPYDALSRAVLSKSLADTGRTDEAIAWAQEAIRLDPKGPAWWRGKLAWAYYLAGRHEDALSAVVEDALGDLLAVVNIRLGRTAEARRFMAEFVQETGYTIADEALWPMVQPLKRGFLDDLRAEGMPER